MLRGNPGLENSQNTSPIPLRLTNGQLKFGGLPAGPSDILELAANLAKLAHDIGPIGDLAEQAGAEIALDCCDALREARDNTQGARVQIIQNALMRLRDTGNHQRAAGGFAGIFEIAAMGGLRGLDR
jgi:hypothetical protein